MSEEVEKRFRRIMDKLYKFPKSKLQPTSANSSQKRKAGSSILGAVESTATSLKVVIASKEDPPQSCRPWDRGDLMRRLATFKAGNWFGKPKVVNPVNCAIRGWVNVGMDTIACEACSSRLLFSTPSYWTFEQVEKAAAVFSLKLGNGHKLLCPWIDNVCDESLASFPPTPATALVEAYRERCRVLLQLSALPIISQSALDYMKCQQLDKLLEQSSNLPHNIDNGVQLICSSSNNSDIAPDAKTSYLYYEAQKIIAFCGWEPRFLPYIVGCEMSSTQSGTRGSSNHDGQSFGEKNDAVVVCSEDCLANVGGEKEDDWCKRMSCDPASAVLDCRLCGACVGLWAFDSKSRPLECFTLVDSPEADNQTNFPTGQASKHDEFPNMDSSCSSGLHLNGSLVANRGNANLNLSIAGGAPPTTQNIYRPRISVPLISRHLRATLEMDPKFGNTSSDTLTASKLSSMGSQNTIFPAEKDKMKDRDHCHKPETKNCLKQRRNEEETCTRGVGDHDIPPGENGDIALGGCSSGDKETGEPSDIIPGEPSNMSPGNDQQTVCVSETICMDHAIPSEVNNDTGLGESSSGNKETSDMPSNIIPGNNHETPCVSENYCMERSNFSAIKESNSAENEIHCETENEGMICKEIKTREDAIQSSDAKSIPDYESREDNPVLQFQDISGPDDTIVNGKTSPTKRDLMDIASCSEVNMTDANNTVVTEQDLVCQKSLDTNASDKSAGQSKETAQDDELTTPPQKADGKLDAPKRSNQRTFDPIQNHRTFCPWVDATEGRGPPGWKLTLLALDKQGESPPSDKEARTKSHSESEDPIVSVRKLFQSPPSKRPKIS